MKVLFVLGADRLQEIAIHKQLRVNCNRPWFGIGLGIVECELNLQVADVYAAEALGHAQSVGVGVAGKIQPGFIVVSRCFHHQRVAFPVSDRVTHEGRVRILRQNTAIGKDLPVNRRVLIQNHHHARRLDQLPGCRKRADHRPARQATRVGEVLGKVRAALLVQRGRPRLHGDFLRLQVRRDVVQILWQDTGIGRAGIRHPPQPR